MFLFTSNLTSNRFAGLLSVFGESVDAFLRFGTEVFDGVPCRSRLETWMSSFHRQSFKALSDRARHAEIFSDRALASLSRRAAIVLLTLKSQMSQMSQMHSLNPGNVTMSDNVCKTKTPNQPLKGFGSMYVFNKNNVFWVSASPSLFSGDIRR